MLFHESATEIDLVFVLLVICEVPDQTFIHEVVKADEGDWFFIRFDDLDGFFEVLPVFAGFPVLAHLVELGKGWLGRAGVGLQGFETCRKAGVGTPAF